MQSPHYEPVSRGNDTEEGLRDGGGQSDVFLL